MDAFQNKSYQPMLIGREEPAFDNDEYSFELKLDGVRALAYIDHTETNLITRNNTNISTHFPELNTLYEQVKNPCVLDGELIVSRNGVPSFDLVKARTLSKNEQTLAHLAQNNPAIFVVFDILYLEGKELIKQPFAARRNILEKTAEETGALALTRTVKTEGKALFEAAKERGLEGIIGKRLESLYYPGKRTDEWVKCKNLRDDDFIICGYIPNKNSTVSIVLGQYNTEGGLEYKGHVILGTAKEDFAIIKKLKTTSMPSFTKELPKNNEKVIWVELKLVCRVTFLSKSDDGLRHPVFQGIRIDKEPSEVRV